MRDLSVNKTEMLQAIANMELLPAMVEDETSIVNCDKLPLSKVSSLGAAFVPLVAAFQNVIKDAGQSGLYQVTVPAGGHLAEFCDGRGFLGSALHNTTNQVGAGQAVLTPVVCDPIMLFMAAALWSIDKKLDKIQESQREIFDFLVQKEKAELEGNLLFLSDVLCNYKYNWNNEKYKSSNHIKALDIRQSADQKIIFYRGQISANFSKKTFIHSDQDVKKQLEKIQSDLKDYQLALYLYSFASFLEIMLIENYEAGFLNDVVDKIENYSFQYRELYTKCYNQIEYYSKSSIQSTLLKGLSTVSSLTGKTIEKIPIISKSQIDETLIEAGDKIGVLGRKRTDNTMQMLVDKQRDYVRPFVENIKTINRLYNKPTNILFDDENLYLEAVE